jgi:hypothetical protein
MVHVRKKNNIMVQIEDPFMLLLPWKPSFFMCLISDFVHTESLINTMPYISWALGMPSSPTGHGNIVVRKARATILTIFAHTIVASVDNTGI